MATKSLTAPRTTPSVKCSFSIENLLAKPNNLTVIDNQYVKLTRENIQKFNHYQNKYPESTGLSFENPTKLLNIQNSTVCPHHSPSSHSIKSVERENRQVDTTTPDSNFTSDENFDNSSNGGTEDASKHPLICN